MPITRTINYTQNVPENLGFGASYINPVPARNIRINFSQASTLADSKMGMVTLPVVPNVKVITGQYAVESTLGAVVTIEGPVADVNTALAGAEYVNNFYEADVLDQDWLSQNPAVPADHRGELCIQINPTVVHGLSVGSFVCISTATANSTGTGQWLVTAIDASNSPTRMWLAYRGGWGTDDKFFSSSYKNVSIGAYLQTTARVNIAPIVDISYCNPHGTFDSIVEIKNADTSAIEESGTITYVGSFFIAEPTFSVAPPTSIATGTTNSWFPIDMGRITQAANNYQSVQYLIKCLENDPMYLGVADYTALPGYPSGGTELEKLAFVGAAINAKAILDTPAYISDDSYGIFASTQVDERVSTQYSTGVVRWNFFGNPASCNEALKRSTYFRPPSFSRDIGVETRIVNERTRIYFKRGK